MKKFIVAVAVLLAASCLSACGTSDDGEKLPGQTVVQQVYTGETTVDSDLDVSNYDKDGNLILVSNSVRSVYATDSGFIIAAFDDQTVVDVRTVSVFETPEDAEAYVNENAVDIYAAGEFSNVYLLGKYVIFTVTEKNETYGKFYSQSRTDVESELSVYEKQ